MIVTLELPDEFAGESLPRAEILAGIVEAGLRRRQVRSPLLRELASMVERLAESPDPAEVAQMRVSDEGQERMEELLAKNREGGLTDEDRIEWEKFERMEYLIRAAKVAATARLSAA